MLALQFNGELSQPIYKSLSDWLQIQNGNIKSWVPNKANIDFKAFSFFVRKKKSRERRIGIYYSIFSLRYLSLCFIF